MKPYCYLSLCLALFSWFVEGNRIFWNHGSIIEEINDFYLTDSNIRIETSYNAIFINENDVFRLKSELASFMSSLHSMHRFFLLKNEPITPNEITDTVNKLFWELKNRTGEVQILAQELLTWSMPHSATERRNPLVLAALSFVGSIAGLGLGVSNRLKLNNQGHQLDDIEHQQEVFIGELNEQIQTLNEVIGRVNGHSQRFDKIEKTQDVLAALMYYHTKIDHVSFKASEFIEKSKDYVEAITLAAKGVLSPHLLPISDLTKIINTAYDRMSYEPLVDFHKIEFYYSIISVTVNRDKIIIDIPFNPSNMWKEYKISPFPTYVEKVSTPLMNSLSAVVLVSATKETFAVVNDIHLLEDCYDILNKKVCKVDSFEFRNISNISSGSCELDLVLNTNSSQTREQCLNGLVRYNKTRFRHRLSNGTVVLFSSEGYNINCPDGTGTTSNFFVVNDGCVATSADEMIKSSYMITRGKRFFINTTWSNVHLDLPFLPTSEHIEEKIDKLNLLDTATTNNFNYNILVTYIIVGISLFIGLMAVVIVMKFRRKTLAWKNEMDKTRNGMDRDIGFPWDLRSWRFQVK